MKPNFLVSADSAAWISGSSKLFAIDPYIVHVLEKQGRKSDFEKIEIAAPRRQSREKFQRDHEFVDRKHQKHLSLLVDRLQQIHPSRYADRFWEKAISLSLLRHVSLCYELFQVCEQNLDPSIYDCRVLSRKSYSIPGDFDDHRRMFQATDFGQEQLFSVYCQLFYPERFTECHIEREFDSGADRLPNKKPRSLLQKLAPGNILKRILRLRSPRLAIIKSYFAPEYRERLIIGSLGRIQVVSLPKLSAGITDPDWEKRNRLAQDEPGFDRFDRYVFACLLHAMPKMLVEDFEFYYRSLQAYFDNYRRLQAVVCEAWIGNALSSLALAVLAERDVPHIYNEHNYLGYPFLGNNLKYIAPLVDEFASLGWTDSSYPNLVPCGSLFNWVEAAGAAKHHELLFISSIPNTRAPEINASYGESGDRVVPGYLNMNLSFLESLDDETIGGMVYRPYPANYARRALVWDQAFVLDRQLARVKAIDESAVSARILMQKSRLIIINYLSTSYLEALIANLPTIILWNTEAYLLESRHAGFFDGLVAAKICHKDPVEAAKFVVKIKHDPESWWQSEAVQSARRSFLSTNIGAPESMIKYLFERAKRA